MLPKSRSVKSCTKCRKDPIDCIVENTECDAHLFYNSGQLAFHYLWSNGKHKVYVVYFYQRKIEYCLFVDGKKVNADGNTLLDSCSYDSYTSKYPFIE